ncbi:hypothetical protein AB0K82_38635, partial [Actinoallomurus sp. NPDC052274]
PAAGRAARRGAAPRLVVVRSAGLRRGGGAAPAPEGGPAGDAGEAAQGGTPEGDGPAAGGAPSGPAGKGSSSVPDAKH